MANDRLRDAYYTFRQRRRVAIALICGSANPQITATQRRWQLHQSRIFRPNRPLPDVVLLQSDRATPSDGGVFLQRDRVMESTSRQLVVDCFATILTAAQNFFAAVTLNDLEGHSPVAGLFNCNPSNICAAFYQIQLKACSHCPSATAGFLVLVTF